MSSFKDRMKQINQLENKTTKELIDEVPDNSLNIEERQEIKTQKNIELDNIDELERQSISDNDTAIAKKDNLEKLSENTEKIEKAIIDLDKKLTKVTKTVEVTKPTKNVKTTKATKATKTDEKEKEEINTEFQNQEKENEVIISNYNELKTVAALLSHNNNRFFRMQAKRTKNTLDGYLGKIITEEEERMKDNEDKNSKYLDIYEYCMKNYKYEKKERTTIRLTKHNHEFIVLESSNAGVSITDYLNYLLEMEEKRLMEI